MKKFLHRIVQRTCGRDTDVIYAGEGNDYAAGGWGNDAIFGEGGDDVLLGNSGNDIVMGGKGKDILYGDTIENSTVAVTASNDYLDGGEDDDIIYGNEGDDIIVGGTGNDVLYGGTGQDTYLYNLGDGVDTINDNKGEHNIVRFGVGVHIEQMHLGSLMLELGNGDAIHIEDFDQNDVFNSSTIDSFEFADGSALTITELLARGFDLFGTTADDVIRGTNTVDRIYGMDGNDTLIGGLGNDTLMGGYGSDTYVFNRGDGQDVIADLGDTVPVDILQFGTDILQSDVTFRRTLNGGLELTITGSTDSVTIQDWYNLDSNHIERIVFGDGSEWIPVDFENLPAIGTQGDDVIIGSGSADLIIGGAGNDTLEGKAGNDTYVFNLGDGADTINDSSLWIKPSGELVSDINTVRFGAGITVDMIAVRFDNATRNVVLVLGNGDSINVGSADQPSVQMLQFADGSILSLVALFAQHPFEIIGTDASETISGTQYSDVIEGKAGNDVLRGGMGNDTYVFNLGDGADTVIDPSLWIKPSGELVNDVINTLRFGAGITVDMVASRFDSATRNIVLDLGNGDSINIGNVDQPTVQNVQFADGTTLSLPDLFKQQPFDIVGTDASDALIGTNYSDIIYGKAGNDNLLGKFGNDTYVYNLGDGADTIDDARLWILPNGDTVVDTNVLRFGAGITSDMIAPSLDVASRNVTLALGNGDSINIGNVDIGVIQKLQFADGSSLGMGEFFAQHPFSITGDNNSQTLQGTDYVDIIQGHGGNDVLTGGNGSDTYIFNLGDGADRIVDSSPGFKTGGDENVLSFGAGITPDMIRVRHVDNGCVLDLGNGDSVDIGNSAFRDSIIHGISASNPFDYFAVQTLQFADGTKLNVEDFVMQHGLDSEGTSANDVLGAADLFYYGKRSWSETIPIPDRLTGGTGNDTLIGGAGGDTYVFNRGDGADKIIDTALGMTWNNEWKTWVPNDSNTLSFGPGISANDITARYQHGDVLSQDSVVLDLGGGDSINIGSSPSYDLAIQTLQFADGSSIRIQDFFMQHGLVTNGTDGAEYLPGAGDFPNYIQGLGGDDLLITGYGNDRLDGGTGNDTLVGNEGSDIYLYNRGDGADVISDTGWVEYTDANGQPLQVAMPNTLEFGAGISSDGITPVWDKNTLTLDLGNGDSISIGAWKEFDGNTRYFDIAVQNLQFNDGSVMSVQDFLAQNGLQNIGDASVLIGSAGDDVLSGGAGDDVLSGELGNDMLNGGAGNDVLFGRAGDDTLDGGAGNDILKGGSGDDLYIFGYGSGQDVIVDNEGWDTIQFAQGIRQSDLQFKKDGSDLNIALANSPDSIIIKDWFSGYSSVNTLQFESYWGQTTPVDLVSIGMEVAAQTEVGSSGDDVLVGSIYYDVLQGVAGNDTLIGGKGDDTYVFNTGDGADSIYELAGNDTIVFGADITPDMLWLDMQVRSAWVGSHPTVFPGLNADLMANEDQRQVLNIQIGNQGDSIQVMSGKGAIENFRFADGNTYTLQQLAAMQGPVEVTDSNDQGGQHRDLDGLGVAADFNGGIGNDNMLGGRLDDIYRFNLGDGQDVIADFGGNNEIAFGVDVSVSDLWWNYDPSGITPFVLYVGDSGDSIAILNGEHGAIQRFSFADGTAMTFDELMAAQGGIDLVAPTTDDQVISMPYDWSSNNLIVGGDGADTINVFEHVPNMIAAGKGNDTINLGYYNDARNTLAFNLGDGQDTVVFGEGSAAVTNLLFGVGIDPASVIVEVVDSMQQGWHVQDMRIRYGNQGDEVFISGSIANQGEGGGLVPNIAHVEFTDGTEWSFGDLMDIAKARNSLADFAGHRIEANPYNPILVGGSGDDTFVIGNQPAEYQIIDSGSNVLELGWSLPSMQRTNNIDNQATLQDAQWSFQAPAVVDTAGYRLSYEGGALLVRFSNGVSLQIDGFNPDDPWNSTSIKQFNFADGSVLNLEQLLAQGFDVTGTADGADTINGTTLNDRIQGLGGDDTITGGAGNDVLASGTGNDTYIYSSGDGADVVVDHNGYWDGQNYVMNNNMLQFNMDIDAASVVVKLDPNNGQVYLDLGNGDSINIGTPTDLAVQSVQFGDGTVWDAQSMLSNMTIEVNPNAVPDTALPLSLDTTITYTATLADGTALPAWLSFDAARQTFNGVPSNWDVGVMNLKINATDSYGNNLNRDFILNVQNVNDAPMVEEVLADNVAQVNTPFSYQIHTDAFADPDTIYGDILSYSATLAGGYPLPDWLSFDPVKQTFSGTPANGDTGEINVAVIATDMGGLTSTSLFKLDVVSLHAAPVALSDMVASTEDAGVTTIAASALLANDTNPDAGDSLTIAGFDTMTAAGNSVSMDFAGDLVLDIGNNYQSLGAGQSATDSFSYTVTDTAGATSSATVDVAINGVNDAPVVAATIEAQAMQQDALFCFTVPAGTFTDVDNGDKLTYSASLADGTSLPSWLTFDAATQTLSGIAGNVEVGGYSVIITATDTGGLSASSVFAVDVANVNDAPTVSVVIADQSTQQNAAFNITVPAGTFNDVDFIHGDTLTYTATLPDGTALPSWMTFDAATQTLSGIAGNTEVGGYYVIVTATDTGGLSASSTFAVDVTNVNDAPTVTVVLADQSTLQDAAFNFTVPVGTFNDVDFIHGDKLTYSATLVDGTALPSWMTFDAVTQTFSGIAGNADVGNLNVLVTATDAGGLSTSSNFALNVINVNDTPIANADAGVLSEDGGAVLLNAATLLANDTDPDFIHGDVLNIVGVSQAASGAAVSLLNGNVQYDIGTLYQSLAQGQTATDTFSYTVSDTAGATSTATVTMTLTGINDAAVTVDDTASVQEDVTVTATGNVLANDTDVDQGTVLIVANAATLQGTYGQLVLNADGNYSYLLDNSSTAVQGLMVGQTVTETFSYQAYDGFVSTPAILTVTLTGTNDGPVAMNDTAAVGEDSLLGVNVETLLASDTDADVGDSKTLLGVDAISALGATVSLNNGQVIYDHGGRFNRLMAGQSIVDSFTYSMTDSAGATSTATVNVTVVGINDGPSAYADNATTDEDTAQTTLTAASLLANDTDPDSGDTLTLAGFDTITALGNTISMDANGNLVFDIGNRYQHLAQGDTVSDTFSYTVSDTAGATSTAQVTLSIIGTNDAAITADDMANVQEEITVAASGNVLANDSDVDQGTVLTIAIANAGTFTGTYGQLILNTNGNYSYTLDNGTLAVQSLAAGQIVTETFAYQASDGFAVTPSTLTITITGTDDAPVVAIPLSNQTATETGTFSYQLPAGTFTDIDMGDQLSYRAALSDGNPLPDWLMFDSSTLTFSSTLASGAAGLWDISVTATDSSGATASAIYTLDIAKLLKGSCEEDYLRGSTQRDVMYGLNEGDLLRGYAGDDVLVGGSGNDVLEGGDGNDLLIGGLPDSDTLAGAPVPVECAGHGDDEHEDEHDKEHDDEHDSEVTSCNSNEHDDEHDYTKSNPGNNLLNGGAGNDILKGSAGNDMLIGGSGNDIINSGAGADIIAFNKDDGQDTVLASQGVDNTLSLGGGIKIADLAFRHLGNDLVLEVGASDQITFSDWYAATANHSILNLQMIGNLTTTHECEQDDDAKARNMKYDFGALVGYFDKAVAANATTDHWSLTHVLLDKHLDKYNGSALGGDLAEQYGKNGSLTSVSLNASQDILGDSSFGTRAQKLHDMPKLKEGIVMLG